MGRPIKFKTKEMQDMFNNQSSIADPENSSNPFDKSKAPEAKSLPDLISQLPRQGPPLPIAKQQCIVSPIQLQESSIMDSYNMSGLQSINQLRPSLVNTTQKKDIDPKI